MTLCTNCLLLLLLVLATLSGSKAFSLYKKSEEVKWKCCKEDNHYTPLGLGGYDGENYCRSDKDKVFPCPGGFSQSEHPDCLKPSTPVCPKKDLCCKYLTVKDGAVYVWEEGTFCGLGGATRAPRSCGRIGRKLP
uniref:Uncharacterized protein n=1 Tax=Chromera velia CCMP2878 TaxID=1169474 RepID=A0A0G4G0R5_9ALVE|eukprot:Cvel_19636.t1-p1 / transcript=Cvel_19636.t1 / gene=Cvel_19636 / organism=Chromera_velia_CCMP2878 / gene_product=hypothetical protein / transcript_product=hypothetical protein / location=Cvel_scaffold1710:3842-4243(-) / protein_length=134 / sequence_SO=supercontig / SO=protein_coding / is_pseudo=false